MEQGAHSRQLNRKGILKELRNWRPQGLSEQRSKQLCGGRATQGRGNQGDKLQVIACSGDWWEVMLQGNRNLDEEGWAV